MYSKKRDDVPCCWVPRREFRWIVSFHTLAFWRPEGLANWPINYGHWYRRDPHWQSSGHLSHLKNREIMTNTIRKILHWMCLVWLYQKKKIFWPLVIHLELLENGERFAAFLFDKIIHLYSFIRTIILVSHLGWCGIAGLISFYQLLMLCTASASCLSYPQDFMWPFFCFFFAHDKSKGELHVV